METINMVHATRDSVESACEEGTVGSTVTGRHAATFMLGQGGDVGFVRISFILITKVPPFCSERKSALWETPWTIAI